MSVTLLLDLDDTLLGNHIDRFLPGYIQALARSLAPLVAPERMVLAFEKAARLMLSNDRADRNLEAAFFEPFLAELNLEAGPLRQAFEAFYQDGFRSLSSRTHPIPAAIEIVREAIRRGYTLAIATNPLFPRLAIQHRLEWAGLPVDQYPFQLVSSAEFFHFSKASPAYYAEVLAHLGWPDGPVVMVGDDPEMDMRSARALTLPTFQIKTADNQLFEPDDGAQIPFASGRLEDVLPWLDSQDPAALTPKMDTPAALLAVLKSTPAVLHRFCQPLQPDQWTRRPRRLEWSPVEIVCHLRDVEAEVNLLRLQKVLQEDNPFIIGQDTDPWAETRRYIEQDGLDALANFIKSRAEIIRQLTAIPQESWRRTARHAIFGRTELIEIINIIAGHDRLHVRQLLQSL